MHLSILERNALYAGAVVAKLVERNVTMTIIVVLMIAHAVMTVPLAQKRNVARNFLGPETIQVLQKITMNFTLNFYILNLFPRIS